MVTTMTDEGVPTHGDRFGPIANAVVEGASSAQIGLAVTFIDGPQPVNVFVNEALAAISGYSVDELRARPPFSNVFPEDLAYLRERYAKRQLGENALAHYELALRHKDGRRVETQITVSHVIFEGRRATITFITDITARKHAEDAARRTEASFRDLIELAPEAIAILRGGYFLYANAAYVKMLGFDSAASLLATPLTEILHPDDEPIMRSREQRILAGDTRLPHQTYRCVKRDGSIILVEASSVPYEHQGTAAVLAVGRDITERKRMEAQLVQADRLAALGTLAAGVAHEVNNPLAYLSLNLEWLARKLPELAGDATRVPELSAMLEEARHGAERVGAIVRELRAFSRADGETRRSVDVRTIVVSAIKIASHEVRHRAQVTTEFQPDVPAVWANSARLEQVLLNLLLNASQAMPETTAEKNEIRVTVRTRGSDRDKVVVEVADNGVGIPPETVRRIFDPFFTTKPLGIGTGLGLSICHTIVSSLGGEISVHSQMGEGSTFRILLPTRPQLVDSEHPSEQPVSSETTRSTRRARVLVVDDETTIANTLRELLHVDHDVIAVTSGQEAIAVLDSGKEFDVVFCDLMMPHVNGMDVYEHLERRRPGYEKRVVFMTGGAFTARAAEFLSRVRNRRIEKPFSLNAVEEIVCALMIELRANDANEAGRVA
jgi:PAS domain S-box-containing protein